MDSTVSCPCGSGEAYAQCCQPFHLKKQYAPSALELMRSRYSAFALGECDYLMQTMHRDHPEYQKNAKFWKTQLQKHCQLTKFQGLSIVAFEPGDAKASVTFEAKLVIAGKPVIFKEKSYFVRLGQRWLYYSGEVAS